MRDHQEKLRTFERYWIYFSLQPEHLVVTLNKKRKSVVFCGEHKTVKQSAPYFSMSEATPQAYLI